MNSFTRNSHLCCKYNFKAILRKLPPASAYSKVLLGDGKETYAHSVSLHPCNRPGHGAKSQERPCPSPAELMVAPQGMDNPPGLLQKGKRKDSNAARAFVVVFTALTSLGKSISR